MDDIIILTSDEDEDEEQTTENDLSQETDDVLANTSLQAGLLNEAFYYLRRMYNQYKYNRSDSETKDKLVCHLLINEFPLKQENSEYQGKRFGYPEGIGKKTFIIEKDPFKLATKAVIITVVSATENWKIPVTVMFIDNPEVKYIAEFVGEILQRTFENGVKIISMTLNSESEHLGYPLAKELGAEIDPFGPVEKYKAFFLHPVSNKKVHILFDIDIVLDSFGTFWELEGAIFYKKDILSHPLISDLLTLKTEYLEPYGIDVVSDWTIIKKRVDYEGKLFDKTVADAMSYLKSLKFQEYEKSGPTIQCVRVFNLISQIFQIDGGEDGMFNKLSSANQSEWKPMFVKIIRYCKCLQLPEHAPDTSIAPFKRYITSILVTLTSLLAIYNLGREYGFSCKPIDLIPARHCLKTIIEGLFEESDVNLTAFETFKLIKGAAIECQKSNKMY